MIKNTISLLILTIGLQYAVSAQVCRLYMHLYHKDSLFDLQSLSLPSEFPSVARAYQYLDGLPGLMASRGFAAASVDSTWETEGALHAYLFPGSYYEWYQLNTSWTDKEALAAAGYHDRDYFFKSLNISLLDQLQQRLLQYYANKGYPFARVYLDSISIENEKVSARLRTDKGMYYVIDSMVVSGSARISNYYLQRHLQIRPGSAFRQNLIREVDKRLSEIPFLQPEQPASLTMLGKGSILNVYLKPRKCNQVNVLVGLMPAAGAEEKAQLTGDVLLDLKNVFGGGQSLLFKWQQLQRKSPRLNLGFTHPYIFRSSLGFDFFFDLFRKDSSFLQISSQAGLEYFSRNNRSGKLFLQWLSNSLLQGGIDTGLLKATKRLPPNADVSSLNLGTRLQWSELDYLLNPKKGYEAFLQLIAGNKKISRNNQVTDLRDANFDYDKLYDSIRLKTYQFRISFRGSLFVPVGKSATVRTSLQGGLYESPDIFRNEVFQIGGFRTLRGFDEESIHATRYAILSLEYRYLIGLNSFVFGFLDGAYSRNKYREVDLSNKWLGTGIGSMLETGAGVLSLTYAAGFRDDIKFDLRRASKLHVGYVHYF